MNRKDIIALWHNSYLQWVHDACEQDYQIDIPARRESFNNYTDMLCEDGSITSDQYNNDPGLPDIYEEEFHPQLSEVLRNES